MVWKVYGGPRKTSGRWKNWVDLLLAWANVSLGGFVLCYVIARMMLIVLAFMAMRSLPVGCYDTVDLLISLPHF